MRRATHRAGFAHRAGYTPMRGLVGLGEAYPVGPNEGGGGDHPRLPKLDCRTRSPRRERYLVPHLYAHSRFPGGSVVNAAISGIEHALWDIAGKAAGVPVYRLLGGKCRDRIRVYQSCGGATPEAIAAHARQLVDQYGYTALKMSPQPPQQRAAAVGRPSSGRPGSGWRPSARRSGRMWTSASTRTPASSSQCGHSK